MPVRERETVGQVMRGFCPVANCGAVTKGRNAGGTWKSKCAHPGKNYQGRMVPGGKKTLPKIPDNIDRGDVSGILGAVEAQPDIDPRHGPLAPQVPTTDFRGLVAANEPRDDEKPAERSQVAATSDPLGVDPRESLEAIAKHARAMAGALAGAQQRVRELEGLVVDGQIEMAKLRGELEDAGNEIARLTAERDEVLRRAADLGVSHEVEDDVDAGDVNLEGVEDDEEQSDLDFDPAVIPF